MFNTTLSQMRPKKKRNLQKCLKTKLMVNTLVQLCHDRINVDRHYIKHCPGLSYLLTCNFLFNLEYGPPNV